MSSLKSVRAPMLFTKNPIIVCPNLKMSKSVFHFSNILISNAYSHFIYALNANLKNISIINFQFSSFLSQPIFIYNEDCESKTKFERIQIDDDGETNNNINICNGKFIGAHTPNDKNRGFSCGGAISFQGEGYYVKVSNIQFENCYSLIQGGAIMIYLAKSVIIDHCSFSRCYTSYCKDDTDKKIKCSELTGIYGAACYFSSTETLSITNTNFTDNYIQSPTNQGFNSNFNSTVVISNCGKTDLNNTEFKNDPNVQCDITFVLTGLPPTFYYNKKVLIHHCCFRTQLQANTISIDISKSINPDFLDSFVIDQCSFYQAKFDLSYASSIQNKIFIDKNNTFYGITEGCRFYPPTSEFSHSSHFTQSNQFSLSSGFTKTSLFTPSKAFNSTGSFTPSNMFSPSDYYTKSELFTSSEDFSCTEKFTYSDYFSQTIGFSMSGLFSYSNFFSSSSKYSQSINFSPSADFSTSDAFSISLGFTSSSTPTASRIDPIYTISTVFSASQNFTIVDEKNVVGTKLSKGGIAGIIIACLVILAIIILLLILFLKRKKSAFIPPEDDPMNIDGLEIPVNMYD